MSLMPKRPRTPPSAPHNLLTIHIIDDEPDILLILSDYLYVAGYNCQTYGSIDAFLAQDKIAAPGCLLVDVMLGRGTDGIDSIPVLKARAPTLPIVIMTAHGDITMAVRAMRLGAGDFLEKPFSMERLTEALIRVLERGHTVRAAQQRVARLTEREREVMQALAHGQSNKEVAAQIGISPRTVEVYRAAIMMKLQLQSFAELVRLAILVDEAPAES